jgi:uncharacterized Zn finger protein
MKSLKYDVELEDLLCPDCNEHSMFIEYMLEKETLIMYQECLKCGSVKEASTDFESEIKETTKMLKRVIKEKKLSEKENIEEDKDIEDEMDEDYTGA